MSNNVWSPTGSALLNGRGVPIVGVYRCRHCGRVTCLQEYLPNDGSYGYRDGQTTDCECGEVALRYET